jgi:membrane protein EpsK
VDTQLRGEGVTARNILANVGYFMLQAAAALILTRFLISRLGVTLYGLLPLSIQIAAYMTPVTVGITSSVGRYLTLALARGDDSDARRVFGTAAYASALAVLVLAPFAVAIVLVAPGLLQIPPGAESSAAALMVAVFGSSLLLIPRTVLKSQAFARNRLDIFNLDSSLELIARVALTVLLVEFWRQDLVALAVSFALAATLASGVSIWVWWSGHPFLPIRRRQVHRATALAMFATAKWAVVNQVGTVLFLSIDVVVVNIALGAAAAGRYGAVLVWSAFLRAFGVALSGVVTPVAFRTLAQGGVEALVMPMRRSVRLMAMVVALPVGLVCGLSAQILEIWLGSEYVSLSPLLVVLTAHLTINLGVQPLFAMQLALNRLRLPAAATVLMGAANLALAFALAPIGRWGLGVAIAGAVCLTAKNAVFTTVYAARLSSQRWWVYIAELAPGLLVTATMALLGWATTAALSGTAILEFAGPAAVVVATYLSLVAVLLTKAERELIRTGLRRR